MGPTSARGLCRYLCRGRLFFLTAIVGLRRRCLPDRFLADRLLDHYRCQRGRLLGHFLTCRQQSHGGLGYGEQQGGGEQDCYGFQREHQLDLDGAFPGIFDHQRYRRERGLNLDDSGRSGYRDLLGYYCYQCLSLNGSRGYDQSHPLMGQPVVGLMYPCAETFPSNIGEDHQDNQDLEEEIPDLDDVLRNLLPVNGIKTTCSLIEFL